MSNSFSLLFWIVLLMDCYFIANGNFEYRLYSKLLLVPIMVVTILYGAGSSQQLKLKWLILTGYLFCFFGDLFLLEISGLDNFILGLLSFLIALIIFNLSFLRINNFRIRSSRYLKLVIVIVIFYLEVFLWMLFPVIKIQQLIIPVIIYALVMGATVINAFTLIDYRKAKNGAIYLFTGSISFMASDSLLAFDRFYRDLMYSGIAVMVLYALALFLLGKGFIRFLKNGEGIK